MSRGPRAPVGPGRLTRTPSVADVAGSSLLDPDPLVLAVRLAVIAALTALGLVGLAQLPLEPPLSRLPTSHSGASRAAAAPSAAGADLLAELDRQEALLEARQRASVVLSSFVGAEITRFFWGGFSSYLDVLGLEPPEDMAVHLTRPDTSTAPAASPALTSSVQLELTPHQGRERYLARVVAAGNVPHGVACRGWGPVGAFALRGDQLDCPPGWQQMPFRLAHR